MRISHLSLLVGLAALMGGCGGSGHASSSTSGVSSAPGKPASPPARSAQGKPASPPARSATASSSASSSGGAVNARLPATFVIRVKAVIPPVISVPASIPIQITLVSGDGRPHHAVLRARSTVPLSVPAGGRATALLGGLPAGRYPLEVDGAGRATLITGAQPGP